MSATITLAPDVEEALLRRNHSSHADLEQSANELLRESLIRAPFLSLKPQFAKANFNELNDDLETEEFVEKLKDDRARS